MHWTPRRERFRAQLNTGTCVYPASVHDPVSIRIAQDLEFETAMFAGSIASLTVLGAPDLIVLNQSEFAEQSYRINRAASLPLIVDADHGYGNALNVRRTVEELETAGVSALTIEDTLLPRSFGSDQTSLVSVQEGVGKMRAALDARQDPSLVIAGRSSAVSITGVDDAITRMKAYEQAGVDMLMLVGVSTREQLESISGSVNCPLMLGGAGQELMDRDYLASMGVAICLQGHQPFMAATQALYSTLKALRDGVPPVELQGLPDAELKQNVMRNSDYQSWIDRYL